MGEASRIWAAINSLRVTALVVLIVVCGAAWLAPVIRFFGRGGQRETVEWLVYMVLGTAFPVIAAGLAWLTRENHLTPGARVAIGDTDSHQGTRRHPREGGNPILRALPRSLPRAASIALAAFLGLACLVFLVRSGVSAFLLSAVLAILTLISAGLLERREPASGALLISALATTAVWASALTLASWTGQWAWASQSIRTPIVLVTLALAAIATLMPRDIRNQNSRSFRLSIFDGLPVLAFILLSFRTTPIVEFYHWGFWTGPIESMRQGGWLLWDVPSQYGFLSLVMPALLPVGDAWQALYLLQAILYVAVATGIYVVMKALRPGVIARVLAFAFTAAALFFRPRTSELILPAQMTPAGGPMRFVWCYAVLAVLIWKYCRGDKVSARRFAITGTLVWIAGVAWSAESAIYCTASWAGAFGVFVLQQQSTRRRLARNAAAALGLLAAALAFAIGAVTMIYRVVEGQGPDWASYYEYALLFSGGYSALPIDSEGAVWYLVVLFAAVSTAVVHFLVLDPRHPRVFVAAGAWGSIWAVSSYFVSRSHPVNLLSLVPLLVFALSIVLHLARGLSPAYWIQLMRLAAVPLICIPAALTISHRGFIPLLTEPQTPMAQLTAQVPAMEPSLAELASRAGMKPSDPVFLESDGRYLMPRWPELINGVAKTSELAWIPKPYEVISTLPPERRNAYIRRFSMRVGSRGGWLVQKKSEINPAYESAIRLIEESFTPLESVENDDWVIRRYVPRPRSGQ